MTRHEDRQILPYSPAQMFELVADIESYPEFLPWCRALRIVNEKCEDDLRILEADMVIAFAAFSETFRSRVVLNEAGGIIDVSYIDGPFKKLVNQWKFSDDPKGCCVEFFVEFEFKSRILELAIGQVFDMAMKRIVDAFESRAKELYG